MGCIPQFPVVKPVLAGRVVTVVVGCALWPYTPWVLKAIIFDFDGVIVDSEPLHYRAFLEVARRYGASFDYGCYLQRYVGYDDRDGFRAILEDTLPRMTDDHEARIEQMCREKERVFEALIREGVGGRLMPGVTALIEEAGREVPLAIASGAGRRDVVLVLEKLGLMDYFAPIVTADDVRHSKPDPTTYALAVRGLAAREPGLGIEPGECLAIEDTDAGIRSARGAGLMALGLATTSPQRSLHRAHRVVLTLEGLTMGRVREWFD